MDTRKVKQIVQLMRKLGITELSTQDITLKLSPNAPELSKTASKDPALDGQLPTSGTELAGGNLSEEDLLFWSTPSV